MTNPRLILVALMWLVPAAALAHGSDTNPADPPLHVDPTLKDCSVQFAPELSQASFHRFAREFGSVSAFKMASPPTTLGKRAVAVDVERLSFAVEEHSAAWNDTFAHPTSDHDLGTNHNFPELRVRMGVTDKLDVGAFFTRNPQANYGWLGLEAKYALLRQSDAKPVSLALRGAYTKTLYVQDMDMHAVTADIAAGRTLWGVLTPYLGVGSDLVLARETSDAVNLQSETQAVPHLLGGLELRLWHVGFGVEAQRAALTSVQAQISAIF